MCYYVNEMTFWRYYRNCCFRIVTDWCRDGVKGDGYELVEGDFVVVDESIVIILSLVCKINTFFYYYCRSFYNFMLKNLLIFFIIGIHFVFNGLYLNKKLIQKYIR